MTTKDTLKKLVEAGKLKRFEPYLREGEVHAREIFMTSVLWKHIDELDVHKKYGEDYRLKVERHLVNFVRGGKIISGIDIKEVEPLGGGVWTFRILESPQTRIFGAFVEKDVFIAFYMEKRSNLSGKFPNFTHRVKMQWKILFNDQIMLLFSKIDDLIYNGVCYDKRKK